MNPKDDTCVLDELAKALAADEVLRAVWVDGEKRSLSIATQPGKSSPTAAAALQGILQKYADHPAPGCPDPTLRCATCEKVASRSLPPGLKLTSLPGSGVLIEKESCATATRFWTWKQFPWVEVKVREIEHDHVGGGKTQLILAILCGGLTLAGFILQRFAGGDLTYASLLCYLAAYVAGGRYAVQEVGELLLKRVLDVHFLMLAVAAGAAVIGHWWEGAVLLFLFSLSDALEDYAMGRTEREIKSLFRDAPREAVTVLPHGGELRVPVESLRPGVRIRIRPGDQVPVDADVHDGVTATDESNLTGESLPVDKKPGDRVLAGTMNLWGRVDAIVSKPASESSLRKIIRLIQEAQESKAPSQRFTDQFGSRYTLSVLLGCTAMFLVWWLGAGMTFDAAFYRTMTLLVVASPCALVLSIPSAILAGIACGARKGVLFRGGAAIEKLAEVKRVAFDKTGTLTTGHLHVVEVDSVPPGRENDVLAHAAALAVNSMHPVSLAIAREARDRTLPVNKAHQFRSITGEGVEGIVGEENGLTRMGRRSMFQSGTWMSAWAVPEVGFTETIVEAPGLKGRVVLRDEVRPQSARLLKAVTEAGLKPTMLTGDRPESAALVSSHLGISDIRAGLSPDGKVGQIRDWMTAGEPVAMVGDGVNDAPSLAAAHVGVAMGMRGSDAALEQADVILMRDRIERFLFAYQLSRKARAIIRQNLTISLGSVAVLVIAAFFGAIPLTVGVIGHEGSTVVVVLNSLRLLWFRDVAETETP